MPGLDMIVNRLATARLGSFPYRHPWHGIDFLASNIYRDRAYDESVAQMVIEVRAKLRDHPTPRRIYFSVLDLCVLAFALRQLRKARHLITRQETLTSGARPKHSFTLTASGKKLARTGWKPLFEANRADDLDATLRIAEMARADNVDPAEIRKFLERSSRTRLDSAKSQGRVAAEGPLDYVATRSRWNRARLEAEAKFLAGMIADLAVTSPVTRQRRWPLPLNSQCTHAVSTRKLVVAVLPAIRK